MPNRPRSQLHDTVTKMVKVLMLTHGTTQNELAIGLGIQQGPVSRRLAGTDKWTLEDVDLLAQYFNVTPQDFFLDLTKETIRPSASLANAIDELDMRSGTDRRRPARRSA